MKKYNVLHIAVLACALIFFSSYSFAGNWQVETEIKQEASYQSNPLMLINNAKEIYGSITTPSIILKSRTPTSSIYTKNTLVQNLFNESEFTSTDFHNNTMISKKIQRWEASLNGSFDYDTTRTSEITTFGIDTRNDNHWGFSINPELSFNPSVSNKYTIGGGYNVSRYDDNTTHTDYNVYNGQFTWAHVLSEFSTTLFSVKARRYQSQNKLDETVDGIGPTIGWQWQASENLSTLIIAGSEASRQKSKVTSNDNKWSWNTVFEGSINYKNQQHDLSVKLSRQQQPYSNGTSSLLTGISFNENYKFNSLLTGSVGTKYQKAKASSLSSSNLDSRLNANAGLTYRLTNKLDLGASYSYTKEDLTNTTSTQTNNTAMLRLVYHPQF